MADRAITPIAGKARTILNSVDFSRLHPGTTPDLDLKGTVIGTSGLFRYKKGLLYLFKALASLEGRFEYTLLLVGGFFSKEDQGPHLKYLDEYGLRKRTVITGKIAPERMADYLQLFDILVFPSLFSEGCPLSMLEGMAMKKAVIGSRTGAIPEVIQDHENGLLVNPGSGEEIAQAIMELAEKPALREKLAENAGRTAKEMSPEGECDEWLKVYETVYR
jgi:glycosyltransferase involved in cell wall biosynthesis